MLWLSEVLLQNPEAESFADIKDIVAHRAAQGERFFRMDIKPPYSDTPPDWEDRLESVFTAVR
mgnify:FL=1